MLQTLHILRPSRVQILVLGWPNDRLSSRSTALLRLTHVTCIVATFFGDARGRMTILFIYNITAWHTKIGFGISWVSPWHYNRDWERNIRRKQSSLKKTTCHSVSVETTWVIFTRHDSAGAVLQTASWLSNLFLSPTSSNIFEMLQSLNNYHKVNWPLWIAEASQPIDQEEITTKRSKTNFCWLRRG